MIRKWLMFCLAFVAVMFLAVVPAPAQVIVVLNGPPQIVAPDTLPATSVSTTASLSVRSPEVAIEPASLPTANKSRTIVQMPSTDAAEQRNEVLLILDDGSTIRMSRPMPRPSRRIIIYH